MNDKNWSNLGKVVFHRTYSRTKEGGGSESFEDAVERVITGNIRGHDSVSEKEIKRLKYFLGTRRAGPAGRGWWFSGTKAHEDLGGAALCNCWAVSGDDWENFVMAQDLLMLGGGVGMSVEHRFVSKLPRIKKDVKIVHDAGKDADFIVPDSREGWCKLTHKVLESFFITGRSFSYSTCVVRGAGVDIKGFGGKSSGPIPLIELIDKLSAILGNRAGKTIRPIDAMDVLCSIGEMVVSGNVRRSAILIMGDCWDKEYLKSKRWDLGPVPTQRAMANLSVICDDVEDLHPLFWKTYENGEPFGIINRKTTRIYARMGEKKKDTAIMFNPCAEASLEDGEPCNLTDIALPNLGGQKEFEEASRLMHRWGKRVTMEKYHHEKSERVIKKNRRVGTGITGCLASPLFSPDALDFAYAAIQDENVKYSKELGIPESIRTTVVKPSGTFSKMTDMMGYEGIHAAYSRYCIQRVRFSANDPLIPLLRAAGHYMEPVLKFDGSLDHKTLVVDFYQESPKGYPVADEDWTMEKQLNTLILAQKHWADQAVSVTIYYKKEEIPKIKEWLSNNLDQIKTISFLCHNDHGFKQAPKEAVTKEEYEKLASSVVDIDVTGLGAGDDIEGAECEGGVCPIK